MFTLREKSAFTVGKNTQLSQNSDFSTLIEQQDVTSTAAVTTALSTGTYYWRVKSSNSVGNDSNFSNSSSFLIAGPLPPEGLTSEWSSNETMYDVTLNWQAAEFASNYDIKIASDNSFTGDVTNINVDSETGNTSLAVGEYFGRIRSINADGIVGGWSETFAFDVGLFQTQLGGSRDDKAKDIIHSRDGGYIILAYTKSTEISETVDSGGDDWIIKLNEHGNIQWQYISSAEGRDRFNDVIELSDGSIVAVGQDWGSKKAVALKLDSVGELQWEILYRPDSISERYDFIDVVEFNGKLLVSGAEWNECSTSCSRHNYNLQEVEIADGGVSTPFSIPISDGLLIDSLGELIVSSDGNLLIGGYALSIHDDPIYTEFGGTFLQSLDSSFNILVAWDCVGSYRYEGSLGDLIELSNRKYAIAGVSLNSLGPAISLINQDGSESGHYEGDPFSEEYSKQSITSGDNGEIYGLFNDLDGYPYLNPLTFMSFNSNMTLKHQSYLLDLKGSVSSGGLVRNNDGTFTLLITNNSDIIVTKRIME